VKSASTADLLDPKRVEDADPAPPAKRRQAQSADPQTPDPEPSGGGGGLVRVTVNLTPKAYDALQRSCEMSRDTKTDTINRALQVYELIQRLTEQGRGYITMVNEDGERERIHIL
jgi:hypothetical protein